MPSMAWMSRYVPWLYGLVALLTAVVIVQVLRSGADPANSAAADYLPLAWMAARERPP